MTTPVIRRRKKPVEVDTIQWTGNNEAAVQAFTGGASNFYALDDADRENCDDPEATATVYDKLHSTWVLVYTGQHIVRGVKGEFYPVAEDVLAETYEAATVPSAAPYEQLADRLDQEHARRIKAAWSPTEHTAAEEWSSVAAFVRGLAREEQPSANQAHSTLMQAHVALAAQAGRDQAAIDRVLEFAASLDDVGRRLAGPDAVHPVAARIRYLLERPVGGEQPDTRPPLHSEISWVLQVQYKPDGPWSDHTADLFSLPQAQEFLAARRTANPKCQYRLIRVTATTTVEAEHTEVAPC
ncbi:hypothetical protein [Streptomyces sp. YKOK-I1]